MDSIYSSCVIITDGKILSSYRRISRGWKEYTKTDHHYKEGTQPQEILYNGKKLMVALGGDL